MTWTEEVMTWMLARTNQKRTWQMLNMMWSMRWNMGWELMMITFKGPSHLWKALPNTETSMAAATIITPVENIQNSLLPKSADVLAPNAGVINIVSNSITSSHNLDSFVQDSKSPSTNESSKSEISSAKTEDEEAHFSNQLDQEVTGYNFPTVIGSDCNFHPSQLKGILLLLDLNPSQSAIRKTIKSQNYEECMSSSESGHEDSFISNEACM
ncbi:hypothetical protein RHSIM_Rhsim01G0156300 [Rhododendron simsii]|uniref:Uncharacterized protein n=1 Tax=Rhododendron simsii TaxID=118357 RepID=A0A834HL24_RHOSS|nr:hypothetical protein RHSIM_Rhsim01G0156300 [Rhododendron simsii]